MKEISHRVAELERDMAQVVSLLIKMEQGIKAIRAEAMGAPGGLRGQAWTYLMLPWGSIRGAVKKASAVTSRSGKGGKMVEVKLRLPFGAVRLQCLVNPISIRLIAGQYVESGVAVCRRTLEHIGRNYRELITEAVNDCGN